MTTVGYYQTLLNEAGMETLVKNEYAQLAVGEVPFTQVYPELWVTEDADYERAVALIRVLREDAAESHGNETVKYKGSQMMKAISRIGLLFLLVCLVLIVYIMLAET